MPAELLDALTKRASLLNDETRQMGEQTKDIERIMSRPLPSHAIEQTLKAAKQPGMNGGFRGLGEFAHAIKCMTRPEGIPSDRVIMHQKSIKRWGEIHENLKANSPSGMNESFSAADGGYLIPPEFSAQILMRLYANDLMTRCTMFPIGGNTIKIPAINETSRANGSRFGGVQAYWRREGAAVTATKPSLKDISLELDGAMLFIRSTQEVLEDTGGALEVLLTTIAAQELAFLVGDAIVNGDGIGKPLGIMNSDAKVTAAAVSGQGAGTIVSRNVIDMYARMHLSCLPTSVWLYDQSVLPALFTMTIGTAGSQLAMFIPPGGLSSTPYGMLMGRPLIPVEFCQPLGTEGDLIFWDPSTYLVATKGGVSTAVSMHLYFDTNEMAFRFTVRIDGKPWWISPLTPKSGSATQSCIVTLNSTRT